MIKPLLLWSDILIFILVASVGLFLRQISKNPQAKKRWRRVFSSKVGIAAFIIICTYVSVALLDSVHFRYALDNVEKSTETSYSSEVHSLLDVALDDLKSMNEKTYSAPFAIYSFSKENLEDEQGRIYRDYPRLQSAGTHLADESEKVADISMKLVFGLLKGLAAAALLVAGHIFWRRKTKVPGDEKLADIPWATAYITLAVICCIIAVVLQLGNYYHILGTDKVGQDVLYTSIKAIRTGVLIGTLATILTLPIAIFLGISAGYFKGWIDDLIQYVYTTLSSIPSILLIAASVLLIDVYIANNPDLFELTLERADFKFLALCGILGMTSWTTLCRLLRAETLKVSQLDYVQAAHAFGVSHMRVIGKHILPNITHIILIALVLDFSAFVLAEAVLAYIGVGVDPSMVSWGNMINGARSELSRDPAVWWSVTAAFIMMFTLVLAANLFSDEVREAFDPRSAKGES
ncbi:ABC transporter permease [Pelagibaculum spongiae]|uniref:Peptide ABC transporter permease n=1 Tax=Pelagibaculum spongiae TaxID=2080658 RepID=A0A2V1GX38_9GAMM|nr:ABC transporter permease [Pelagibaculum spongiae]PVZ65487.1 peptide ABC transporter permease [Pelagibaculum spongiae]